MDSYGDHALTCPCNGDRTVRHNALRNLVCTEAALGGMAPEREKPGLLPARPLEDGVSRVGAAGSPEIDQARQPRGRRPADVFLPRGTSGRPMALDFACTSGMRSDWLRAAREDPKAVITHYENFKRDYRTPGDTESTDEQRQAQGFQFVPMVIEAHGGGWGKGALQVLDAIAKSVEAAYPNEAEPATLRIAQRLSISLQKENARAILRRLADASPAETGSADDSSLGVPALDAPLW